jgi:hypothetical protein
MITIERKHECKSYWKNDGLYDCKRSKEYKLKIFGLTIWRNKENYDSDLVAIEKDGIGFKK